MDIEELSLEQIINHEQFYSLKNLAQDTHGNEIQKERYWEVIFKAKETDKEGRWVIFGETSPFQLMAYFKLKKK